MTTTTNRVDFGHVLIVGGTGMLRDVSLSFARRGIITSVVGKSEWRMETLMQSAGEHREYVNPILTDYTHPDTFKRSLLDGVAAYGPYTTCVAWIHSQAKEGFHILRDVLEVDNQECQLYHVRSNTAQYPRVFESYPDAGNLRYHRVLLGYEREGTHSRWLTDEEIANGVLGAIESAAPESIVGIVDPWEERP